MLSADPGTRSQQRSVPLPESAVYINHICICAAIGLIGFPRARILLEANSHSWRLGQEVACSGKPYLGMSRRWGEGAPAEAPGSTAHTSKAVLLNFEYIGIHNANHWPP